ncbi:SDR family oxidoreductase [Jonesiaceae bacterium BS-20]|uniref:SDR family oxidoreductase n=1 Tax=Jonesiaceae bacterium BS-20 TaxID=3120821 RepID=A0AAU7DSI8_9MICO
MRTYVITGGASGIGAALVERVRAAGNRAISVDINDADVVADLSTPAGCADMIAKVTELTGGVVDVVVANAGISSNAALTMAINYYGAIDTLEGLRPLLLKSQAPRAVITASMASLQSQHPEFVDLILDGTREEGMAKAEELSDPAQFVNYPASKAAIARWMRRVAPGPDWAGAGIPLNAIAPGIVITPMTEPLFADPVQREHMLKMVPMPLNGATTAEACAAVIDFLAGVENTHLCGQVLFVDGGYDAVTRKDSTW